MHSLITNPTVILEYIFSFLQLSDIVKIESTCNRLSDIYKYTKVDLAKIKYLQAQQLVINERVNYQQSIKEDMLVTKNYSNITKYYDLKKAMENSYDDVYDLEYSNGNDNNKDFVNFINNRQSLNIKLKENTYLFVFSCGWREYRNWEAWFMRLFNEIIGLLFEITGKKFEITDYVPSCSMQDKIMLFYPVN